MNNLGWHWLAGFYEGEGGAGCYWLKKPKQYMLDVNIVQANKDIIYRIRKMLGYGNVYERKVPKGCKRIWVYQAKSTQARRFLMKILPFLRTRHKTKQVVKALRIDSAYVSKNLWHKGVLCN